jgi:hypothetical protein
VQIYDNVAGFFLEREMFETEVVDKKTELLR